MGVITFTSCFIQNFTNASYFSGMFLGFKVRRKKKQINEISLMSLYLKIHPTGRPVLCWSMIPSARIVVLITVLVPFKAQSKHTIERGPNFYGKVETAVASYDGVSVYGRVRRAPHHLKDI